MAEPAQIPAWIALFMGLYALSASIGELLNPGTWQKMLEDFGANTGLSFLTGIVCIGLGGLIYLASPWNPDDWLAVLVTVMGAGMAAEGCVMLAFGERFYRFARALLGTFNKGWAWLSALLGVALIAVAILRL